MVEILNSVLGHLWGSSLSLTLIDYQSLLTTNVDALTFLNQLATDIHITGTYDQLASANVTVGQLIQALAETTASGAANGDTTAALLALRALQMQVTGSVALRLSDIIDLTPLLGRTIGGIQQDDQNSLQLNIMSLLSADARESANANTINLGTTITIPVADTSVSTRIAIGSKMAQVADAQIGTSVHTGQIRMALTVTAANVNLGLIKTTVQLPIYLEVATGQAELTAMPCVPGGTLAEIAATSKLTTLGFGTVSDAALSNFSMPVTPVSAPIVSATLLGIPIQINISGSAGVNGSGPDTLSFTQSDIDTGTIKSPSNANITPFDDLSASTTLSTSILGQAGLQTGLLNSELNTLLSALKPVVNNSLTPLNGPVNSVLTTLGVQLGTIDVRVFDASLPHSNPGGIAMLTNTPIAQASYKPHVLICDDDAAFSSELIEVLHMRGYAASALLHADGYPRGHRGAEIPAARCLHAATGRVRNPQDAGAPRAQRAFQDRDDFGWR